MKKLIFGMFLGFLALHACKKSDLATEAAIDTNSLPEKVTEYIGNNYPDAAITSVVELENSTARHIVELDNQEEIAFDRGGDCLGDGGNFHGDNDGDKDGDGHHGGGNHGNHGGNGHHGDGGKGHGDQIPVDSLPATILSYLAANYAGYTPKHAETDTLCSVGAVYEVAVFNSTDRLKLYFDPAGAFLMSGNRVDLTTVVPQAVKDLLTANYTGYTVRNKAVKLTLADGSIQYIIFVKNGSDRKKLFVKEDGTLVCEQ